jgi:hypothetical protein
VVVTRWLASWLLLAMAAVVAACGGGGDAGARVQPRVAVYGDSLHSGGIQVAPDRLAVPPHRRLQQLLGDRATVIDYSWPGAGPAGALAGAPTLPMDAFAEHLKLAQSDVVVIRYGGVDVVWGTPVERFEADLLQMVQLAQAAQRQVLLAGLIHHPDFELRCVEFDAAIRRVAGATGARFADTMAVPMGGFIDPVHPDQAYADALVGAIVAALVPMLAG